VSGVADFLTVRAGQLFTLANDEVQVANFRGRLERSIQWLRDQGCDDIYVMAHSTGCVVSYETLCASGDLWNARLWNPVDEDNDPPSRVSFFTLGEALNLDWRLQPTQWWHRPHQWRLFIPLSPHVRSWLDFHAGQDLVPAGPVAIPEHVQSHLDLYKRSGRSKKQDNATAPRRQEHVVTNKMDILGDHGGYWDNDEEVLSRLACEIDCAPDKDWTTSQFYQPEYMQAGRARRLRRVGWLAGIRLAFYVALVAALLEPAVRRTCQQILGAIPGLGGIGDGLRRVAVAVRVGLGLPTSSRIVDIMRAVFDAVPAVVVLLLLFVFLYYILATTLWQQWDMELRNQAMREAAGTATPMPRKTHGWLVAAAAIPLGIAGLTIAGLDRWQLGIGVLLEVLYVAAILGVLLPGAFSLVRVASGVLRRSRKE
jgi:hypothetical protein